MNYSQIKNLKLKDPEDYRGACMTQCSDKTLELSEDYILPDYLPDAKKILKFITKPVIETRFLGSSGLEYSGSVYCRALYLAEDSSLRSAIFSLPFEDRLSAEGLCDECVDFLTPCVTAPQCRLQNPRKMNVRMKLTSSIEIWQGMETLPEVYGGNKTSDTGLQMNLTCLPSMNVICVREDDLSISEDITLDKSMPDIDEIIFADAEVIFDECRGSKNEIMCRGNLLFECIYRSPEGANWFLNRVVPISENLSAEGAEAESMIRAKCLTKIPDLNIVPDEFGNRRVIELDLSYLTEIVCMNRKNIFCATDAYSVSGNAENSFSPMNFFAPEEKIVSGFSVGESLSADDCSLHSEDVIIAYFLRPEMHLADNAGKHGKMAFEGECKVSLLVSRPENPTREVNFTLPLRFESDRPHKEGLSYSHKTCSRASGARVRFDGERIYLDFEVTLSSLITKEQSISMLSAVRLTPESEKMSKKTACIKVYYPSKEESLWDISKKYSLSPETITLSNGINGTDIPSVVKIPF